MGGQHACVELSAHQALHALCTFKAALLEVLTHEDMSFLIASEAYRMGAAATLTLVHEATDPRHSGHAVVADIKTCTIRHGAAGFGLDRPHMSCGYGSMNLRHGQVRTYSRHIVSKTVRLEVGISN